LANSDCDSPQFIRDGTQSGPGEVEIRQVLSLSRLSLLRYFTVSPSIDTLSGPPVGNSDDDRGRIVVREISQWLKELGMSEYAQCFAKNRIDFNALRDLTDQDLKDIGVVLGDRRKILRAISALASAAPTLPPIERMEPNHQETAERRQITVMFSDLVGSTALSARMDPEDLREVISAYQKCVAETISGFGGFVAKYMGDGALVYFGYPQAHEDDPERAVRAALELVAAVGALKPSLPVPLQTRVGIATGLVVVGDLIGFGQAQERGIVGETPNLAARLQGVAEPDTVVIAESTRRLIGNLFELQDLGVQDLKGIAGPVRGFAALRASSVESRFEAMRASNLTPFVGREDELETLLGLWRLAKHGNGQVAVISGEPGIGKSRLAVVLQERLRDEPHLRFRYYCAPYSSASPLYPIINTLERSAGFERSDSPERRAAKLDFMLQPFAADKGVSRALIADLLSLPVDQRSLVPPMRRKELTLLSLVELMEALAARQPLFLFLEDAHWADPTSIELLNLMVVRASQLKMLLLITARPEFTADWISLPHVTSLPVVKLGTVSATAMIERIAGASQLPASVKQEILSRTDGVPLFIEELTGIVIERGQTSATVSDQQQKGFTDSIPTTLQASLLARVDRLAEGRNIAQIAAVIGRDFSYELLDAVSGIPAQELTHAIDLLTRSQVVSARGVPPNTIYRFKHALVRDAAYSSLLRRSRKELHARIAEILEHRFQSTVRTQPELIARHCAAGGLAEKAIDYWYKAGLLAQRRAAMTEASTAFAEALDLLRALPVSLRRHQLELDIQLALSRALIATDGYAAPTAGKIFDRARELCDQLNQPPEIVSVLYGQWAHALMRTELKSAQQTAEQLLHLGEARRDDVWTARGCRLNGLTCIARGEFDAGRIFLERGLQLLESKDRGRLASFTLYDPQIMMQVFLAWSIFHLGHINRARQLWDTTLIEARQSEQPFTLPYALTLWVNGQIGVGDFDAALRGAEELVSHCDEHGVSFFWGIGMIFRGCSLVAHGSVESGSQEIERGLTAYRRTHGSLWLPFLLTATAEAYGTMGRPEHGLRCLEEAQEYITAAGPHWSASGVHRVRGELLLSLGNVQSARTGLHRARDIARSQQARLLELRVALSLARHACKERNNAEARDLLMPVYSWFPTDIETPVHREARELLGTLNSEQRERESDAAAGL
jgi:class 3 adenylate cyclase/tetratricopeptide (TPR) repeat protein